MVSEPFGAFGDPTEQFIERVLASIEDAKALRTEEFAKFCDARARLADERAIKRAARNWLPKSERNVAWNIEEARNTLFKSLLHPLIAFTRMATYVPAPTYVAGLAKLHAKHVDRAISEASKAADVPLATLQIARKFNDMFATATFSIDEDMLWLAKGRSLPPNKTLSRRPVLQQHWPELTARPYLFYLDAVLGKDELKASKKIGGNEWYTFAKLALDKANSDATMRKQIRDQLQIQLDEADVANARGITYRL